MVILKTYNKYIIDKIENKENIDLDSYKKSVYEYMDKLEKEGWVNIPIEGGLISPDLSTLYIYSRSPYEGRLLQWRGNTEKEYKKICKEFIKNGDFIERDY